MLYPYIKEQYESLHREIQGLKGGDPTLLISNAVPDVLLLDNYLLTLRKNIITVLQKLLWV